MSHYEGKANFEVDGSSFYITTGRWYDDGLLPWLIDLIEYGKVKEVEVEGGNSLYYSSHMYKELSAAILIESSGQSWQMCLHDLRDFLKGV